jgi:AcrR family transcriptional regulator
MIDTRDKIMNTAEGLFAAQGVDATSLRQIISQAGVNLAAIHYHFGTKEELLGELVARKAQHVNAERLARLDRLEDGGRPDLEKVLEALLLPMADTAEQNPQFVRLMGRIQAEGRLPQIIAGHFQPVVVRFVRALRRLAPELTDEEFGWRVHFLIGAMAHTMCTPPIDPAAAKDADYHARLQRLVTFLAAGFRAPVTQLVTQMEEMEVKQ